MPLSNNSRDLACGKLPRHPEGTENLMSDIDTKVRHVTKAGSNLFEELRFAPDEAGRYQAEARKRIEDTAAPERRADGKRWRRGSHRTT